MKPALSVIFFTVVSGVGFGLVTLTVLLAVLLPAASLPAPAILAAGVLGTVLATAGLLASTLHLANPKNAWRAFFRFRTSWLSREAVFSVLFYPFVVVWLGGVWLQGGAAHWLIDAAGLVAAALAVATVFCTGMIYASLRTIPQWHNALVPANYLLLAGATGALALTTVTAAAGGPTEAVALLTLVLVVIAAAGKAVYYFWIGKPQGPTLNTGIGITRAQAKLLETGESSRNFLEREFGHNAPEDLLRRLRAAVYLLGFGVPGLLVAVLLYNGSGMLGLPALLAALAGMLVERWLFFAEARHVVNVFYGR